MVVKIPAASNPEKILEAMLPACHTAILRGASSLVYQEEDMTETMGRKGPSARPTKKRQTRKDHPLDIAAMHAVTTDHASI